MRYPDHFLVSEAWRKADAFGRAAEREQLLNVYRAAKTDARRHRAARFLLRLAERLEPSLTRTRQPQARPDGC